MPARTSRVQEVTVDRPAPGTPPDTLYTLPTAPSAAIRIPFTVANADYPLPLTVFRPFFDSIANQTVKEAHPLQFTVNAKSPAAGVTLDLFGGESAAGATFDPATRTFTLDAEIRAGRDVHVALHRRRRRRSPRRRSSSSRWPDVPSSVLLDRAFRAISTGLGLPQRHGQQPRREARQRRQVAREGQHRRGGESVGRVHQRGRRRRPARRYTRRAGRRVDRPGADGHLFDRLTLLREPRATAPSAAPARRRRAFPWFRHVPSTGRS